MAERAFQVVSGGNGDRITNREEIFQAIDATRSPSAGRTIFDFLPHLTDFGNAERFAYFNRDKVRYCDPWGKWIIWDGKRWAIDRDNMVLLRAKEMVRFCHVEISRLHDDQKRAAIANHLAKCESDSRIRAMLHLAQAELPVNTEQLDVDPWLFNVQNGTLDLRTGELRDHNPNDLITKIVGTSYDPEATCPRWLAFLDRILRSNVSLIHFLQKAIGYALTGDTTEQCLFILYGPGANGKSTLIRVAIRLLKDYAGQASADTFMIKRNESLSNDIAILRGARFVSATEVEEGKRLAESLIKQLTGQDWITVRHLYSDFFSFQPQFKIFLATNHRPTIRGTDHAIWRRIRLIPFDVTIPPEKQDPNLSAKLESELPGILNWTLEGCKLWQEEGLGMPDEVKSATDNYQNEMDVLSAFFEDCCVLGDHNLVKSSDLYGEYSKWTERSGEYRLKQRTFSMQLQERGFDSVHREDGNYWLGIGLRDENST